VLIANRGGAGVFIPNRIPSIYKVTYAGHQGAERLLGLLPTYTLLT
jgi:hypothetical protein